ncbi:hypothetical protein E8E11_003041 [Didymella keratinophila]|nr:hypothetical protein E8E11_003041 [Didymella keratinophila]
MAPTLRSSTQDKTKANADAATRAGYVRRLRKPAHRKPVARNKRYRSTRGLVDLQHITDANAGSPLLRLPPEIRNIIFEMAAYRSPKTTLHFNRRSQYSGSGFSSYVHKKWQTATLMYRVNCFSFTKVKPLNKWLSKRLPAELEAVEHLELLEGDAQERAQRFQVLKDGLCPNLRSLTKDEKIADALLYRLESARWL